LPCTTVFVLSVISYAAGPERCRFYDHQRRHQAPGYRTPASVGLSRRSSTHRMRPLLWPSLWGTPQCVLGSASGCNDTPLSTSPRFRGKSTLHVFGASPVRPGAVPDVLPVGVDITTTVEEPGTIGCIIPGLFVSALVLCSRRARLLPKDRNESLGEREASEEEECVEGIRSYLLVCFLTDVRCFFYLGGKVLR